MKVWVLILAHIWVFQPDLYQCHDLFLKNKLFLFFNHIMVFLFSFSIILDCPFSSMQYSEHQTNMIFKRTWLVNKFLGRWFCWFGDMCTGLHPPFDLCSNHTCCICTGISQLSSSPALPFEFYTFGIPSLNRVEAWVSALESPISSSNTSDWIMFSDGTVDLQQVSRILFSRQIVQYKHWYTIIKLPIDGEYMYHL